MSSEVLMAEIPVCDFCEMEDDVILPEKAYVDGRTRHGGWAYMCRVHWAQHGGTGGVLGTGHGQRLILKGDS